MSVARNVGIEAATGEYIIFVDSDDMLAQCDVIQNLVDFFVKTRSIVIYCTNVIKLNEKEELLLKSNNLPDEFSSVNPMELITLIIQNRFSFTAWIFVVQRVFILENSLFFKKGLIYEDMEWIPRLLFAKENLKINIFTKPFYVYRNNPTSITSSFTQTHFESLCFIISNLIEKIKANQNIIFMKLWLNINLYNVFGLFEKDCLESSHFYNKSIDTIQQLFRDNYKFLNFRNRILYIFIKLNPKLFFILRKWVKKVLGR